MSVQEWKKEDSSELKVIIYNGEGAADKSFKPKTLHFFNYSHLERDETVAMTSLDWNENVSFSFTLKLDSEHIYSFNL